MNRSHEIRSKYLSLIIPVYNEEESIPLLHERISKVLSQQPFSYEVLYVDDGSKDNTFTQLARLAENDEHVRIIRFRRNFGQTAAMAAGADHSCGEILVFIDGDLQNDPIDIPRLLAKIDEGYDVVSGWRKDRQDAQLSRKLPSMLANKLIAKVTGVHLHDYGCTLKAYRYDVFRHLRLYGEMHRFIPAYASLVGASITEIPVTHHARQFGKSKYGISRTVRVFLDLITVKFFGTYATRPAHTFGKTGLYSLGLGAVTALIGLIHQILPGRNHSSQSSWLSTSVLFSCFGILSIMLGQLGELLTRTYYESQGKTPYIVKTELPQPTQPTNSTSSNEDGSKRSTQAKTQRANHTDTVASR